MSRRLVSLVAAFSGVHLACAVGVEVQGDAAPPPSDARIEDATIDAAADAPQAKPGDAGSPEEDAPAALEAGALDGAADGSGDDGAAVALDAGDDADATLDGSPPDAAFPDASLDAGPAGSCAAATWKVTASISASNNPPSYATDGLPPTRWSTGTPQVLGQYIQVDFGGAVLVDQIALDDSFGSVEHEDYPGGITVYGSADGVAFASPLVTATYPTDPGSVLTLGFPPAAARAIRVQLTALNIAKWWSIHELRVGCQVPGGDGGADGGGDAGAACTPPAGGFSSGAGISRAKWTGSASATAPADSVSGAFDGNTSTRWSTGAAEVGGEWFQLDLGQATSISQVVLYVLGGNTTDIPSAYEIDLSTDGSVFAPAATGLGGATTVACFPTTTARYVRITQTGTGLTSWWSIYEISVFP